MEATVSKGRVVFMGTPEFAVESLRALIGSGIQVAAVITAPDRPAGRGQRMRMSPVKEFARERGLRVMQPEKLRDPAFLTALDDLKADLYIVVAFRMLPAVVWQKPLLGTINLHGSLLPAYRGAAPINWAIINGETRTGATTFFIREEIDAGDVLDRIELTIGPEESAGELHDRLMSAGATLLASTVQRILGGDRSSTPQGPLPSGSPMAPKLTPENCRVDWHMPVQRVHDQIRGLSPFPGAWTMLHHADGRVERFKILRTILEAHGDSGSGPGSIAIRDQALHVCCADGWVAVVELQPEGRKRMAAADFIRGAGGLEHACFQ